MTEKPSAEAVKAAEDFLDRYGLPEPDDHDAAVRMWKDTQLALAALLDKFAADQVRAALAALDRLVAAVAGSPGARETADAVNEARRIITRSRSDRPSQATECRRCWGSGEVPCDDVFHCDDPEDGNVTCPDCAGEGKVPAAQSEEQKG